MCLLIVNMVHEYGYGACNARVGMEIISASYFG